MDTVTQQIRETKIICTIGPASVDLVGDLAVAGMDVARVNFSHGSIDDHSAAFARIREAEEKCGRPIGIMADLPGPKVRIGEMKDGAARLHTGAVFTIRSEDMFGSDSVVGSDYENLAGDLRPGDRIMLADGAVELEVRSAEGREVRADVVRGGVIRSRAGISIPAERLSLPGVTDQDRRDLRIAVELGADFIAQSFVRTAEDVRELRALIQPTGPQLVAKIETKSAVDGIGEILSEADCIILARGDLGVQVPFEELPIVQKRVLGAAADASVPSVVATQMLESMIQSPRPTRAETTDVANAVLDGTDAILLSAETAIGAFPVEVVTTASSILMYAESDSTHVWERRQKSPTSDAEAIAQAAALLAHRYGEVVAIACVTRKGLTAHLLAGVRPGVPVFALTPDAVVARSLTLRRPVVPYLCEYPSDTDSMIAVMDRQLLASGLLKAGAMVLLVAPSPVGPARTNFLKIHRLGSAT